MINKERKQIKTWVKDYFSINLETFDKVREHMKEIELKYPQYNKFYFDSDCDSISVDIVGVRLETDEEYEERIKKETEKEEKKKRAQEQIEKRNKERYEKKQKEEYELFLKLKKKYEEK